MEVLVEKVNDFLSQARYVQDSLVWTLSHGYVMHYWSATYEPLDSLDPWMRDTAPPTGEER